jgi:UPF0755 protein
MTGAAEFDAAPVAGTYAPDEQPHEPDEGYSEPEAAPRPRSARHSASTRPRIGRRGSAAPARRGPSRAPKPARAPRPSSARTRRLVIALGVLALIIAALALGVWSTLYRRTSDVAAGKTVTVVIASGSSGDAVAASLAKAGVIANPMMFRIQAQTLGATGDIKAGTYTFVTGSDYEPVIRRLQKGPEILTITLAIPEGWGIERTAARVQDKLGIPEQDFIDLATTGAKQFTYGFLADNPTDSLEGYLFPKTYQVKKGAKAVDVINMMLTQYQKETAALDYAPAKAKNLTPHDILTIASIIEREASVAGDRPNVASVIYNRLAIHMRLQLDSTVQYALNGKAKLTLADLKTDSPYNTYMNAGLPPGPICSPGLIAIQAALSPAKTKYLYYILTYKDGRQSFATNYTDFLKLKAQFKKGLK